jgi:hypothetical protein
MLRLAFAVWTLCALLNGVARTHAQAPSDASQPAYPALPAPPAAWPSGLPPTASHPALPPSYELLLIERELARLRAARPQVFWPFALTVAGAATAVFGTLGVVVLASTWQQERYVWDAQGNRHQVTYVEPADRDAMRTVGAVTVIGLGVAAVGVALLVPRLNARRRLAQAAAPLKRRRLELLGTAQPSLSFDQRGATAAARFAF